MAAFKPRFRLHFKPTGPGVDRAHYWACSVTAPSKELITNGGIQIEMTIRHSGPCTTVARAIAEAALLYRRYWLPNARRMS